MRNDLLASQLRRLPSASRVSLPDVELMTVLEASRSDDPVLHELSLALATLADDDRPESVATFQHLIHAIQLHLGWTQARLQPAKQGCTECLASWQIRRATELMHARLGEKIRLAEVAEACGLSTSYFSRLFKNTTGMTTHQWLLVQRVERAKVLLSTTRMPIVEIAFATGFADQTHMTRVFSKRVQSSPLVWRRLSSRMTALRA